MSRNDGGSEKPSKRKGILRRIANGGSSQTPTSTVGRERAANEMKRRGRDRFPLIID